MTYRALKRFAKRLIEEARKNPTGQATLRAGWLVRRYFKLYEFETAKKLALQMFHELTAHKVELTELSVVDGELTGLYVQKLTVRLTLTSTSS